MIRVVIADDQDIVRDGLQLILETDPEIRVVGLAADGAGAIEQVEQQQPDIVLMDLKMPGLNGIQATQEIHRRFPEIPVLVLTTYDGDDWVFGAIRSGAVGYLLKDTPRDGLIEAVKGTTRGNSYIDPAVANKVLKNVVQNQAMPAGAAIEGLTERERDILRLLARGLPNSAIAEQLHLSEGTVRNYITTIFAKLDVTDRTQAAILALRYGLG